MAARPAGQSGQGRLGAGLELLPLYLLNNASRIWITLLLISALQVWQNFKDPENALEQIYRDIDNLNRAMEEANSPRFFSAKGRLAEAILAIILITVSLCLSIGEAAYQYRLQSLKDREG